MSLKRFDSNNYIFNHENRQLGIYLIHGFSSTTYEMNKLMIYLSKLGYQVRADNLPGHATTVDDCNNTTYEEWISFVERKVAEMYTSCKKVIVIGVSMGGSLALHLAAVFPLDGVVAASCIFQFKNEFNVRILTRLFHRLKPKINKGTTFAPDQLKAKKLLFYGYQTYPLIAVNEMRKMVDRIKMNLFKIKNPVLLIHSKNDSTAPFNNFHIVKNKIDNKYLSLLILEKSIHNIFDDDIEQRKIKDVIFNFIKGIE